MDCGGLGLDVGWELHLPVSSALFRMGLGSPFESLGSGKEGVANGVKSTLSSAGTNIEYC